MKYYRQLALEYLENLLNKRGVYEKNNNYHYNPYIINFNIIYF